jgi:hypothetical protein
MLLPQATAPILATEICSGWRWQQEWKCFLAVSASTKIGSTGRVYSQCIRVSNRTQNVEKSTFGSNSNLKNVHKRAVLAGANGHFPVQLKLQS